MTTFSLLVTAWAWEPSVWIGGLVLLLAYAGALHFQLNSAAWWFIAGVGLMVWALIGPLDVLGDGYLFSAHMLQHLVLILAVAPCLLLGLPQASRQALMRWSWTRRIEQMLGRPLLAWSLHTGTVWLWHLPVLYEAALRHEAIHIVQHLTFLITAVIFWWPLFAPNGPLRRSSLLALLYLFGSALASSVLGIILTFATVNLYPTYLYPRDPLHILPLLRVRWGLSSALDQQMGGLFMWVVGGLVYLLAMMGALARWYSGPADTTSARPTNRINREGVSDAA
ncbi:MAG: cytochrome c oxidase assembly protein [Herpetosiphonaceae bacterium]|nr:cytochrome c oxidase assembly protein [Herpetosiphonaceae bacterium]